MESIHKYEVRPFGKFPLTGCFDEAYISAISSFGINPALYLLSEKNELGKNEKGFFFSVGRQIELPEFEANVGIESLQERFGDCATEKVIDRLKNDYLVIARVREISGVNIETGRKTQRSFSEHWVLIYGYDSAKNQLIVLEHSNNLSTKYAPCLVTTEEFENAYKMAQMKEEAYESDIYSLRPDRENNSTPQNEELFAKFISKYRSDLQKEQKALEMFLDEAEPGSMYISVLNQVIKKYQKEQWLYKEMGLNLESVELLLRELFLLRTFCVRAQFNGLTEPDEKIKIHVNSALECCQRFYTEKKNAGF